MEKKFNVFFFEILFFCSEKADLKSRSDSIGIGVGPPHLDSIYTTHTPSGFHHHAHHHSQGSPEAMKVRMNDADASKLRMAACILQPPTRV